MTNNKILPGSLMESQNSCTMRPYITYDPNKCIFRVGKFNTLPTLTIGICCAIMLGDGDQFVYMITSSTIGWVFGSDVEKICDE